MVSRLVWPPRAGARLLRSGANHPIPRAPEYRTLTVPLRRDRDGLCGRAVDSATTPSCGDSGPTRSDSKPRRGPSGRCRPAPRHIQGPASVTPDADQLGLRRQAPGRRTRRHSDELSNVWRNRSIPMRDVWRPRPLPRIGQARLARRVHRVLDLPWQRDRPVRMWRAIARSAVPARSLAAVVLSYKPSGPSFASRRGSIAEVAC